MLSILQSLLMKWLTVTTLSATLYTRNNGDNNDDHHNKDPDYNYVHHLIAAFLMTDITGTEASHRQSAGVLPLPYVFVVLLLLHPLVGPYISIALVCCLIFPSCRYMVEAALQIVEVLPFFISVVSSYNYGILTGVVARQHCAVSPASEQLWHDRDQNACRRVLVCIGHVAGGPCTWPAPPRLFLLWHVSSSYKHHCFDH
jgi:hypothetical protein